MILRLNLSGASVTRVSGQSDFERIDFFPIYLRNSLHLQRGRVYSNSISFQDELENPQILKPYFMAIYGLFLSIESVLLGQISIPQNGRFFT